MIEVSSAVPGVPESLLSAAHPGQMGVAVGAPDALVEVAAPGPVGGPESGHAACAPERPALTGAFHARLQHVAMRALDGTRADRIAARAVVCVLHALGVVRVVADEVVDGLGRGDLVAATVELAFAGHHLRDHDVGTLCEQLLAALLPNR